MRFSLILLTMLSTITPAWAENRAVIIGNADYRHAPDLAGSDTGALAGVMRKAGFATREGVDLPADEMRQLLDLLAMADPAPGTRIVMLSGRFLTRGDETWFMGVEAQDPDAFGVAAQGVPLGLLMQLIGDSDRDAVLLLGVDQQAMPHGPGLESGIGVLPAGDRVSVITGTPEATARALRELAAGRPVARALAAGQGLKLLPGGNAQLIATRPAPPGSPLPAASAADRRAWAKAMTQDSAPAYSAYLDHNPAGAFAISARERRAGLRPRVQPPNAPDQVEAVPGLDHEALILLQTGLARLGFDPGPPDGLWGHKTRQALQDWQRGNGLDPSGQLDAAQLGELRRQITAQGPSPRHRRGVGILRLWTNLARAPQSLLGPTPRSEPPQAEDLPARPPTKPRQPETSERETTRMQR